MDDRQALTARDMLRDGCGDAEVERATGATLGEIIGLRAASASAPAFRRATEPAEESGRPSR